VFKPIPSSFLTSRGRREKSRHKASASATRKVPDSGKVTFAGPAGTLWPDAPSMFTGKFADFGAQDGIDLPDVPSALTRRLGTRRTALALVASCQKHGTHMVKIALLGNYMASNFVTAADGRGGTLIAETPTTQQPTLTQLHT
jgi:hypothetical protein